MKTPFAIRRAAFLLVPLALSACISLPFGRSEDQPAPTLYTLHDAGAGTMAVATEAMGRIVVVVPAPELPPGFDTQRIAIQFEQDGRLDYYADAQWSATLDELIQDVLIDRAQRKLPGTIVGEPELVPAANYRLAIKISNFGPVYGSTADSPPRLDAGLTLTVIELPQETVKAQLNVRKSAAATANRLGTVTSELRTLLYSAVDDALERASPYITEPQTIVRSN